MTTWNQKNASKINGTKSKGPVTADGKARSSQNGLKHGLYATPTVLRNEDPDQYAEFREVYLRDYAPVSVMETDLVLDIVDARWRLRRFRALETAALEFEMERMRPEVDEAFDTIDEASRTMLAFNSLISLNRTLEVLQTAIRAQHRLIDRATSQLLRLRRIRPENDGGGGNGGNDRDDRHGSGNGGPRLVGPTPETPRTLENQATEPEPPAPAESCSAAPASQPHRYGLSLVPARASVASIHMVAPQPLGRRTDLDNYDIFDTEPERLCA